MTAESSAQPQRKSKYSRLTLALLALVFAALAFFVIERWTRPRSPDAEVFSAIYKSGYWGSNAEGEGHSGSGSSMKATVVYRAFLQEFLAEHKIRSVVDAGCGDWEFSQSIDWRGIDYKGYDIVEDVIAKNQKVYTGPHVHFFVANIVDDPLPEADLLICKHVLQHLPNRQVAKFLTQLTKYKHVLLTNGVDSATYTADNDDIAVGGYRPLDVTRKPFMVPGKKILIYWDGFHIHEVVHLKRG